MEARLGDLDMKSSGEGKGEYWRKMERVLIEEGWYTNRLVDVDSMNPGCGWR